MKIIAVRVLFMFPFLAYLNGMDKAQSIRDGREYNYFIYNNTNYKFLGKISDYFVALPFNNINVRLIATSKFDTIELIKVKNEKIKTSASKWFCE